MLPSPKGGLPNLLPLRNNAQLTTRVRPYKRRRFPPAIFQYAVWLYYRFSSSHRDIEDLLAQRRIEVSHESNWLWCNKSGPTCARRLRRAHAGYGDTFFIDEVFVKIQGKQQYLWRAVDLDGEVVDVFVQARRDGKGELTCQYPLACTALAPCWRHAAEPPVLDRLFCDSP